MKYSIEITSGAARILSREGTVFDHLTKVGLSNSFIWKQKYITNERRNT